MEIAMITVDREPQYAQSTLASMFRDPGAAKNRVRICVSSTTAEHLGAWKTDARVEVETMADAEAAMMMSKDVIHRAAINSARAVQGEGGLFFCHDDLEFTSDWTTKLDRILARIDKEEFILSLWSSATFPPGLVKHGYAPYNPRAFFGDIAYYVSPKARARLKVFLWEDGYEKGLMPADLLVQKFCLWSTALYVAVPNLVQHMGSVSTGCSGWYPTSPTYLP